MGFLGEARNEELYLQLKAISGTLIIPTIVADNLLDFRKINVSLVNK
jgi:hypothetical protein